jgi:hypothetical protein
MNSRSLRFAILVALFALTASAARAGGAKVQVCHIPPGNPANFHTITISENALQAHLDHGDLAGACSANCDALCSDPSSCTTGECACPCLDGLAGFIEALNGQFGLTACRSTAQPGFDLAFLVTGDGRTVGSQTTASGNNFCGFAFGGSFLFLTESEALRCNALVRQKAAAAGLTCVPF